jgi:hypothetical protein
MQQHRKATAGAQVVHQKRFRLTRDVLFEALGILTFVHEVLLTNGDRLPIILAAFALMGLPVATSLDQFRKKE